MTFDEASKLIKKGDAIRLREALHTGLDPNLENRNSWTLLMVAAMEGNTSVGSLLIESGAALDKQNTGKDTALSLAAHCGHGSFVHLLLKSGASLICYPFGKTLDDWINWACKYGRCSEGIRGLFHKEQQTRAERDRSLEELM